MNKLKDLKLKNQLIIVTYIMIFLIIIIKPTLIPNTFRKLITAFKPFIIGGAIAFLINIPMKLIEEKIVKPLGKKYKYLEKMSRVIALISALTIVSVLIGAFINYIVPQLLDSLITLTDGIPDYIKSLQNYITENLNKLDVIKYLNTDIPSLIQKGLLYISNITNMIISNLFNFTLGITNFFVNLFLAVIIAIYILLSKEKLILQFKKLIYAFISEKKCEKILYVLKLTNYKFSRFILGQSTDGLILGTVFFIALSLFKIPYALLISILIPISNFVPIFGTYIGIAISAFIILMVKPTAVILFLVIIITIQQIDGKFIYPVVVGNSLGLSSLWILLAIVVGGNLFGILGMLLGMPLLSVVYELFSQTVNKRLKNKDIDIS
ncbi:AI-2E family transporter [Clostridium sp. CCUG 7971]|uniref:AI-2E family transporter n=1 Tax=Clostridium sp. CCUG 7971 TaxID=2811414 RepID=UPI001ABAD41A|nr:AI-2E family transporter [Clostridium sp. CCUG 7971]MBO3443872.1 AI-2E family transporter [Clostridium sp. CCUG 7971]